MKRKGNNYTKRNKDILDKYLKLNEPLFKKDEHIFEPLNGNDVKEIKNEQN